MNGAEGRLPDSPPHHRMHARSHAQMCPFANACPRASARKRSTEAERRVLGGAAVDTGLPPEWAEPAIRRPVALFFVLFFFMCVAHAHEPEHTQSLTRQTPNMQGSRWNMCGYAQ